MKLSNMYNEMVGIRDPQQLANLLITSLPMISEAEQAARTAGETEAQTHRRQLSRIFSKLATYCDLSPTLIALEYLRYKSARKRKED